MVSKYVGYIRVSTQQQSDSGLGLQAQRRRIESYVSVTGGELIEVFEETGSGFDKNRQELKAAIKCAQLHEASIVVSVIDRLTRDVSHFDELITLTPIVCTDTEIRTNVDLRDEVEFAEKEGKLISDRTINALNEARQNGVLLGGSNPRCRNLTDESRAVGRLRAAEVAKTSAYNAYIDIAPQISEWRSTGCTLQQIADRLNADGHTTRRGKLWNHVQVRSVLIRTCPELKTIDRRTAEQRAGVQFAQQEGEKISARTKVALAAYRARGGKLGSQRDNGKKLTPELSKRGAQRSGEVSRQLADSCYLHLKPQLIEWRSTGLSLRDIASRLNELGHCTRRGKNWNQTQVRAVLMRFGVHQPTKQDKTQCV